MKTYADFKINLSGKSGIEIYTQCPECSQDRKKKRAPCLSVNTEKECWICHHCGWTGSLKEGGKKSRQSHWEKPVYRKPREESVDSLTENAKKWFLDRKITFEVLVRNKIASKNVYMPQIEDFTEVVSFPYYRGRDLVNLKHRDFFKNFRQEAGAEQIFYGLNDIQETTIICEGEIDKLSLEVAGYKNTISVPAGAPAENSKNYTNKFDFLNDPLLVKVKQWILAVDDDPPGHRLEEELLRRLGRENCRKVQWPAGCKDANDVLIQYGINELSQCIKNSQYYPLAGIFELKEFSDQLDHVYRHGWPKGISTGWSKLDEYFTVAPGQMTMITGVPSHGKSEWLDAMSLNLSIEDGWIFGVYSPENYPLSHHAAKLIEKFLGKRFRAGIAESYYEQAKLWVHDHFKFILPEQTDLDHILKLAKGLVRRNGIQGLILDPWNEIDHQRPEGMNETEYISGCLSRIRQFARENKVHVFLVAHPTKLQKDKNGEYPVPTPYDISGSAHFRNKADNCVTIWRNLNQPEMPVKIYIQKIRFNWIGKIGQVDLIWDERTTRYL